MASKHILQSKTFWANAIALLAMAAAATGLDLGLTADTQTEIVVGILAVVNIVLRLATDRPVRVTSSGKTHFMSCPGPLLGLMLLALAAVGPVACGGVSARVSELTGTTLEQRCANYRLTLLQWQAYRESGGDITPEREALINAGRAFLDANCGPPAVPR